MGLDRPLIVCSDNHKVTEYSVKVPLWFRADPTFRGLLMILREPRDRVYIGERPPELLRVEQIRPSTFVVYPFVESQIKMLVGNGSAEVSRLTQDSSQ